jgi:hypothetical protein
MNKIVKHINGDKTDNRIENLAYVSRSECSRDMNGSGHTKYEFVDKLPEGSIPVKVYCNSYFENLYYYDNKFYLFTGKRYRIMHEHESNTKRKNDVYVLLRNCGGDYIRIFYSIFKRIYKIT